MKNRKFDCELDEFMQSIFGGTVFPVHKVPLKAGSFLELLPELDLEIAFDLELCAMEDSMQFEMMQIGVIGQIIGMYLDSCGHRLHDIVVHDDGSLSADLVIAGENSVVNLVARVSSNQTFPVLRITTQAYVS